MPGDHLTGKINRATVKLAPNTMQVPETDHAGLGSMVRKPRRSRSPFRGHGIAKDLRQDGLYQETREPNVGNKHAANNHGSLRALKFKHQTMSLAQQIVSATLFLGLACATLYFYQKHQAETTALGEEMQHVHNEVRELGKEIEQMMSGVKEDDRGLQAMMEIVRGYDRDLYLLSSGSADGVPDDMAPTPPKMVWLSPLVLLACVVGAVAALVAIAVVANPKWTMPMNAMADNSNRSLEECLQHFQKGEWAQKTDEEPREMFWQDVSELRQVKKDQKAKAFLHFQKGTADGRGEGSTNTLETASAEAAEEGTGAAGSKGCGGTSATESDSCSVNSLSPFMSMD